MGKSGAGRGRPRRKEGNPNESVDALGYRRIVEGGKPGERRSRPQRIGNIIPQIIARYGLGRKLSIERYQETFKKSLADLFPQDESRFYTDGSYRLIGLRSGILRVCVSDAPLMSEFAFYKGEILRRMREAMPDEKIRDIRFTLINN